MSWKNFVNQIVKHVAASSLFGQASQSGCLSRSNFLIYYHVSINKASQPLLKRKGIRLCHLMHFRWLGSSPPLSAMLTGKQVMRVSHDASRGARHVGTRAADVKLVGFYSMNLRNMGDCENHAKWV